jgi:aldose 1-epimerase
LSADNRGIRFVGEGSDLEAVMRVDIEPFGVTRRGDDVLRVRVDNGVLRGSLINYGARLVELHVPDAAGQPVDVVLGYDDMKGYELGSPYLGATCGRYGNRIRQGRFSIDEVEHRVVGNENGNHLHGGSRGFDQLVWSVEADGSTGTVTFSIESPDGDQGYPGRLKATTSYQFDGSVLRIRMTATADAATVVNLVHHSYWNLAGHDHGSVLDHELMIEADTYTPVDDEMLPTGEIRSVDGTPFDFRELRPIGRVVDFDHNWVLRGPVGSLHRAAVLSDPTSGRMMTLETTEPGLQVYSGRSLGTEPKGKAGSVYGPFAGVAMESQRWPDSPNLDHFPDSRLRPGQEYRHDLVATFTAG